MSSLGPSHQLFLQAMMHRGAVSAREARELYRKAASCSNERYDDSHFPGFLSAINRHLKPLGMELAQSRMEASAARWYGLVNRVQDPAAKIATSYSQPELEFFNKVLEQLVQSEDGIAASTALLHSTSQMERKITYKDAQAFLKTLKEEQWLEEVSQGVYGPGPRFILELRPFLRELFGDDIIDCRICKEPALRGQYCGNDQCTTKLHLYCLAKLASGRGTIRCPGCHGTWSHDIPEIELDVDEGARPSDHAHSSRGTRPPSQPMKATRLRKSRSGK